MSVQELQDYLRINGLHGLREEFSINVVEHPTLPLFACKYSQIDSPKTHPIVRECRGIVLERSTWRVVAKPFRRFFNACEDHESFSRFGWGNCSAATKEDGSLIILYHYRGEWHVNTSGSFGLGDCGYAGKSWREVFWQTSKIDQRKLDTEWTYLFELCTPHNRVIRVYPEPSVFLLSAIHTQTGCELPAVENGTWAAILGVKAPQVHQFASLAEVEAFLKYIEAHDKTFEGLVLRDHANERFKVKTSTYLALHHLYDNGNVCNPKRIVPLVLAGECDEVLSYFPEAKPQFDEIRERLDTEYANLETVWQECRGIESQKEFAQAIIPRTPFSSLLFAVRKSGGDLQAKWRDSADLICNRWF